MTYERFVKQLDGCTYCSGGLNCNCASGAMWLYRASQGKIKLSSCDVRRLTGDRVEGTNLEQILHVAEGLGIKGATLWRPGMFAKLRELILTGRYGAIIQVGYRVFAGTEYDCFGGSFRGGHSEYLTSGTASYVRGGDPGADGRRPTIPEGWQDFPWAVMERAAAALPLNDSGLTVGAEFGSGRCYALLTPPDPLPERFNVEIKAYTPLTRTAGGPIVGAVKRASYRCGKSRVNGRDWFHIISRSDYSKAANAGLWFHANAHTEAHAA